MEKLMKLESMVEKLVSLKEEKSTLKQVWYFLLLQSAHNNLNLS